MKALLSCVVLMVAAVACDTVKPPIGVGSQGDTTSSLLRALKYSADGGSLAFLRDVRVRSGDASVGECDSTGLYLAHLLRERVEPVAVGDVICAIVQRSPFLGMNAHLNRVAFASDSGIGVLDLRESDVRMLTSSCVGMEGGPVWSPTDNLLAFSEGCERPQDSVAVVVVDSGGIRAPGTAKLALGAFPSLSVDGSRLAIVTPGPRGRRLVGIMPTSGAIPATLAEGTMPAWSPDGNMLAFVGHDGEDLILAVVGADGMNRRELARLSELSRQSGNDERLFTGPPVWHRSGDQIAIGTATAIWKMPLNGSRPIRIVVDRSSSR